MSVPLLAVGFQRVLFSPQDDISAAHVTSAEGSALTTRRSSLQQHDSPRPAPASPAPLLLYARCLDTRRRFL
ncbi:unnamed protein product [Knipowitschia caucasica]|uniref:Uncharacterized protein n=1 Tax=Knipowitschia caucasica TaxID=637954 RepID=A0AAV2LBW2_KNICA